MSVALAVAFPSKAGRPVLVGVTAGAEGQAVAVALESAGGVQVRRLAPTALDRALFGDTELGREIRAAFIPRPGWKLLVADYSQIELRLLAHMSGDAVLTDAFQNGEDIHTRTAAEVFGVGPLMVTPEHRRAAKAVNFGIGEAGYKREFGNRENHYYAARETDAAPLQIEIANPSEDDCPSYRDLRGAVAAVLPVDVLDDLLAAPVFDVDTYKILKRYLAKPPKGASILRLAA